MNSKFSIIILFAFLFAVVLTREIPAEAEPSLSRVQAVAIMAAGLCLNEHNNERAKYGKGGLTYDTRLEKAAQNHNNVMISQNCFSHQCSGEPNLGTRVSNAGYRWRGAAENIAAGPSDCKSVMQAWMNSAGHKANILGDSKNVGCARNNKHWTCVFGTPA